MTRPEAIEHLKNIAIYSVQDGYTDEARQALDMAIKALEEPERKMGKWIWWYEETFTEYATEYTPHCKCSECGRECAPSVATSSNFCRNCGADMRTEGNDDN